MIPEVDYVGQPENLKTRPVKKQNESYQKSKIRKVFQLKNPGFLSKKLHCAKYANIWVFFENRLSEKTHSDILYTVLHCVHIRSLRKKCTYSEFLKVLYTHLKTQNPM